MLDWIQDLLPWSDVPPWIGALVGVGALTVAVRNVGTARRAYLEGTWDRKVAVARLVWSEAAQVDSLLKGQAIPWHDYPFDRYHAPAVEYGEATADGVGVDRVKEDSTVVLVTVVNNSKEPIGGISVDVHSGDAEVVRPPLMQPVLRPESSVTTCYVTPSPRPGIAHFAVESTIYFSDSAGHRWRRQGTRLPETITAGEPERSALARMRGRIAKSEPPPGGRPAMSGYAQEREPHMTRSPGGEESIP